MNGAQARAFMEEFVETVLGSISAKYSDKVWFDKVGWDGSLLMLAYHTFGCGKVLSRCLKSELAEYIQTGIIRWYEEEKLVKAVWDAVDKESGLSDSQKKKANGHLMKSYDDAHYNSPYGTTANDSADIAELQDFVKGWMGTFAQKAYAALENGLSDSSPEGQKACLTTMFQHLLDPNVAAIPLKLQNVMQPAPWAYIEQCANEVVTEMHDGAPAAKLGE